MTDAELDAKIKDVALDCEDFYVGAVSLEFVAALTDLRAARAELAKVRTKSEERLAAIHRLRRVIHSFLCDNDHLPENDSIEDLRMASNEAGRAVKDP